MYDDDSGEVEESAPTRLAYVLVYLITVGVGAHLAGLVALVYALF